MTHNEMQEMAKEAAREAVREWLTQLGLDASDPAAIVEIQRDFAHVRAWRTSVDAARSAAIKTGVGVLVSGFLGALWLIFKPTGH